MLQLDKITYRVYTIYDFKATATHFYPRGAAVGIQSPSEQLLFTELSYIMKNLQMISYSSTVSLL